MRQPVKNSLAENNSNRLTASNSTKTETVQKKFTKTFASLKNCCTFVVRNLQNCGVYAVTDIHITALGTVFLNSICIAISGFRNLEKAVPFSLKNTNDLNFY